MCEMLPRKLSFSQCRTVVTTICLCDKTNYTRSKIGICYRGYRPITAHAAPPVFYRLSSQLKNNCSLKPVFYNTTRWPTQSSYFRVLSLRSNISPQFLAGPFIRRAIHHLFSLAGHSRPAQTQSLYMIFGIDIPPKFYEFYLSARNCELQKTIVFSMFFSDNRVFGICTNRANPPFCPSSIIFSQIPNKGIF